MHQRLNIIEVSNVNLGDPATDSVGETNAKLVCNPLLAALLLD